VFEAVAGAILIDSSLDVLQGIYGQLLASTYGNSFFFKKLLNLQT
jgi:hypothetical protein